MSAAVSLLSIVKLANTGTLLWSAVGPLVERLVANGEDAATMDEVEAAQLGAGAAIDGLRQALKDAEDAQA